MFVFLPLFSHRLACLNNTREQILSSVRESTIFFSPVEEQGGYCPMLGSISARSSLAAYLPEGLRVPVFVHVVFSGNLSQNREKL